jgi:probable phosphoglycerate mutase
MTTFLLIRHGHTDWIGKAIAGRSPGVGLSAEGAEQALNLPRRVRNVAITAICSSPLQRTRETAEPLAQERRLPVEIRPRLIEVDFGSWTGKTMTELDADPLWKRFNTLRGSTRAPGGELMLDVQSRMVDELEELRRLHGGNTVAVVSHQDAIKAALAHYAGIPLDLFHRFEISPASVSVLQLAEWGPRIVSVNHTGDLVQ